METVPVIAIDRNRLKTIMNRRGIRTYAILSEATKIHQNSLVRMLHSEGFNTRSLTKLASALQCNPLDLLVTHGFAPFSLGVPGEEVEAPGELVEAPGDHDTDQDEPENNEEPGGAFDPDDSDEEGELVPA